MTGTSGQRRRLPNLGNHSLADAPMARAAAVAAARDLRAQTGYLYDVHHEGRHAPGQLPHYHVVRRDGVRIPGHFFYGPRPRYQPPRERLPRDVGAPDQIRQEVRQAKPRTRGPRRHKYENTVIAQVRDARDAKRRAQREVGYHTAAGRSDESPEGWLFEAPLAHEMAPASEWLGETDRPASSGPEFHWESQEHSHQRPGFADAEGKPGVHFGKFTQPLRGGAGGFLQRAQQALMNAWMRTNKRVAPDNAGRIFQTLVAKDLGARFLQNIPRMQDGKVRRSMDVGTRHEVTLQGMQGQFDRDKVEQFKKDLVDLGALQLTVPFLSAAAEQQLRQLAQDVHRQQPNRPHTVIVRQTHDTLPQRVRPTPSRS